MEKKTTGSQSHTQGSRAAQQRTKGAQTTGNKKNGMSKGSSSHEKDQSDDAENPNSSDPSKKW